jgi:TolB-like protein
VALLTLLGQAPEDAESLPSRLPSVVVMGLSAKHGAAPELAELLTDGVVAQLRQSGRYSRVVAYTDVTAALGLEQQRLLADCGTESCVAQIVASLGADFVVLGSVGRAGALWICNLKLVDSQTAATVVALTRSVNDPREEALVQAVTRLVDELMGGGAPGFAIVEAASVPVPEPAAALVVPPRTSPGPGAAPGSSAWRPVAWAMRGLGGAALVTAGAGMVLGAGMGTVAAVVSGIDLATRTRDGHQVPRAAAFLSDVSLVTSLVILPAVVVAVAGGGAVLGASWLVP